MTRIDTKALDKAVAGLHERFPGPGGVVAVVKDGAVAVRHAWGYADLGRRVPFAPQTLVPICSITKQFTCALLLDVLNDPARLDGAIAGLLPRLQGPVPRTIDLANNQSGLRDYWALTVLCGATPEGAFRPADFAAMLSSTRSLHFAPGTRYSYSNGNFRMLSMAIAGHAGRSYEDLLMERIVGPAGMERAVHGPETGALQGGAVGYEGDQAFGYVPAVNNIHWSGDAGLCATLDDMIAWEQFIDRTREDADGLYNRLSAPAFFADGRRSAYGLGLAHLTFRGRTMTGHGGALRGWRCKRLTIPSERLSVVVLFNHTADAHAAALHVLGAALGETQPVVAPVGGKMPSGPFLEPESGLLLDVRPADPGRVSARFATGAEDLVVSTDGAARSEDMILVPDGSGLRMERPGDNIFARLFPVTGDARADIEGIFQSDELGSRLTVSSAGGAISAEFDGLLGRGPAHPIYPVAEDLWRMPCQRSMDAPAPGDWTVGVRRSPDGDVEGLTVGCWLARGVEFRK